MEPHVNHHFLEITHVQTKTWFDVPLFAKHRLLPWSGQGLSASLLLKHTVNPHLLTVNIEKVKLRPSYSVDYLRIQLDFN